MPACSAVSRRAKGPARAAWRTGGEPDSRPQQLGDVAVGCCPVPVDVLRRSAESAPAERVAVWPVVQMVPRGVDAKAFALRVLAPQSTRCSSRNSSNRRPSATNGWTWGLDSPDRRTSERRPPARSPPFRETQARAALLASPIVTPMPRRQAAAEENRTGDQPQTSNFRRGSRRNPVPIGLTEPVGNPGWNPRSNQLPSASCSCSDSLGVTRRIAESSCGDVDG